MRKTTNYGLVLYDTTDKMNITGSQDSLNASMEIIDSVLKEKANIDDIFTKEEIQRYIDSSIPSAVEIEIEEALLEAKESGEFKGDKGDKGEAGKDGENGTNGIDGKSAYQIWLEQGNLGTEQDFLNSLKGTDGINGKDGTNGVDGKDGYTPIKGVDYFDGINGKDGEKGEQGEQGIQGEQGPKGDKGDKGDTGATGNKGADGYTPVKGKDYWTEAELQEIDEENKSFITDELAKRGQLKPEFANSLEDCTDQTKIYVLPDGNMYAYIRGVTPATRGNFGVTSLDKVSAQYYTSTKTAYSFQKNGAPIGGQLKSITVNCAPTSSITTQFAIAHMNGNVVESVEEFSVEAKTGTNTYENGVKFDYKGTIKEGDLIGFNMNTLFRPYYATVEDEKDACFTTTSLADYTYSDKSYGFAISAVVETPEQVGYTWGDTGHEFVPADYEDRIIALEKSVSEFAPDEEIKISEFTLANPTVKSFMESGAYDDNDYSYTNMSGVYLSNEYYRKDLPLPIIIGWNNYDNAVEYVVSIISTDGTKTYYTEHNRIAIYNLIPNVTYNCKVYGLCADGTKVVIKDSNFITSSNITRMLNIDGIQNVRDVGGYSALNGKRVKYGMLYRGSAMDETIADTLSITDAGKQEIIRRVGIKTDLDLRTNITKSVLGNDVDFRCIPYHSYTTALTETTYKANFKTIFDYIVTQLQANKPVYFHCQAGCDRTGTIAFLLLGLLGVSESDLAKEYELSSLSAMGKGFRTRNSTIYNYSGMVDTIKTYSGTTITDKFVSYATECGITSDTITNFRNLMIKS